MDFVQWTLGVCLATSFIMGCREGSGNKFIPLTGVQSTLAETSTTADASALTPRVKELFAQKCFSCHGESGANAGNVGDIRNLEALREKKLVLIGKPDQSKIYNRLVSKEQPMPPPPAAPLQSDEIELVKAWIMEEPKIRSKISYQSLYEAIEKDFNTLSAEDKVNTRYFHLVNN